MSYESPNEEPLARYSIHRGGQPAKKWMLFIFADRLEFESAAGDVYEVNWAKRHTHLQMHEKGLLRRMVVLTVDRKNHMFQLEPDAFEAIQAWYGPLTSEDLRVSLKRRFTWVLPIGILFVFSALPIGPLPFEPITFGLGIGLILAGTLSKVVPHRIFFLLDSLWFCMLAANAVMLLYHEWGWFRFTLLLIQLLLALRGFQEFHRFAPSRMQQPDDADHESA